MLHNATPLRKSAPGPPNSSDEHVSCTAPAMENASLQILFTCPTPAIVFGNATKPSRFAHFLTRCTIPCTCHAKRHLNVQKWSEHVVFLTCSLRNVLRAPTACTFSTSLLPKVVRTWCVLYILTSKCASSTACTFSTSQLLQVLRSWGVLYILTSKCASRHNGVRFFDISTSKSGPNMWCFYVLLTCWLRNVLRATTACNFLISHLPSGLRTRRFSEPTFRPSRATNIGKTVFRNFPTFSRTWTFSFFFSSLLWLSSLTLHISAFHLSILSEVWLLNFLRW